MKSIISVFVFETKLLFRRKQTIFYTFFIPALLLFVFVQVGKDFPDYAQFVIPGLIGMVALSHSIQSISPTIGYYKISGVWKRVKSSPLKVWKFTVGLLISRFILILCGTTFLILLGHWTYNFQIRGNLFYLFIFLSLGILSFMSIGLFVSSFFKTIESISLSTSMIVYPMLFLSNAFWPIEMFPKPLGIISQGLPLTQMVHFSRLVINGEPLVISQMLVGISIILIWLLACFFLGVMGFVKAEKD
jgi:ABC-2 type transport system permease protein